MSFAASIVYGYRKGFLDGLISICSCLFSFFVANFFGRFFLRSSFFGVLGSFLGFQPVFRNGLKFDRGFLGFGVPAKGFGGFDEPFSNYFILWLLMAALFVGFKRFFKKLFVLSRFLKKLPIIDGLDGFLGAVFGALEATVFVLAVAGGCFLLIMATQDGLSFLNLEVIKSTNLFFLFYRILPFIKI